MVETFTPTSMPAGVTAGPPLMPGLSGPVKWRRGVMTCSTMPL